MILDNDEVKMKELGSFNEQDLKKILDYYDSKVPITGTISSEFGFSDGKGRYGTIKEGDNWSDSRKPNFDDKGKIKWTRIDLKKLLNKKGKKVPEVMYISNGYVAYKVKGEMYSSWRVGDLYMLKNDVITNSGRKLNDDYVLKDGDDVGFEDIIQRRTNTKQGFWTSGWNQVKEAFEDWYNGNLKTYHGEYRDGRERFAKGYGTEFGSMKNAKQAERFEGYNTPERLLNFDVQEQYPIGRDAHDGQIKDVRNDNRWTQAFGGADSYEVLQGGLSDPFYNIQWWPSRGGDFQFNNSIPFEDAFGEITYDDIIKEFEGTPIGYMAKTNKIYKGQKVAQTKSVGEILFGKKPKGAISSKLKRNIATFPEDENARGESINFAQNSKKSKNKDGTMKKRLQWRNNRAVIFNPNSTFQFARTFGNKKGQKIRYVSRKAGDGLVIWREQGFARLAAENARRKGYLIRTVPVAGGYVNLMAKRKHYFEGQEWFDEIQHGYTEENRKYLEERGIPADDRRTRYPRGRANDYYRRLRR